MSETKTNPTHIIIIPYKNRKDEMTEFNQVMPSYFDTDICIRQSGNWEIWYIEQNDEKLFNRGALKNIGALEAKKQFGDDQITVIMHDVDVIISQSGLIRYECQPGEIAHPYGELDPRKGPIMGCFCIMRLGDFMTVGGFPNYYGWGLEDVVLGHRCLVNNIKINESNFIHRYSHSGIIDKPSHTTQAQVNFNRACHSRNLSEFRREQPSKPTNCVHRLKYNITNTTYPCPDRPNIKILHADFSVL